MYAIRSYYEFDFAEAAKLYKEGKVKESKVIPFSPVFLSKDVFVLGVYFILFFVITSYSIHYTKLYDGFW